MSNSPLTDKFPFRCTCCGDCCSGAMEIDVNIFDLHKLARRLEMKSTGELFRRRLVRLAEGQNGAKVPRIVFRTSPYSFCPWLINDMGEEDNLKGYCSLHPHDKPLVCKLAPLSRAADPSEGSDYFYLTPPTENCPGMSYGDENSLAEIKNNLKRELDYEMRFYAILDRLTREKKTGEEDYMELYTFDCRRQMEDILKERE